MNWNKLRKQLETFIHPSLLGRIDFIPSGYRISNDKKNLAYILVDKDEILAVKKHPDLWCESEQALKKDSIIHIQVTQEMMDKVKKQLGDRVPEQRLMAIVEKQETDQSAKKIWQAQKDLLKSDFQKSASDFLAGSLDQALTSDDILQNIFAVIDRRTGKKRVKALERENKHPLVLYFCRLRS